MEMLHAVADDAQLSQRGLARQLNVALGLTNAYLKRCIRKGWIKVQRIPPNRYAYYLTPKGFSEKTRLTADYFYYSFRFYRRARNQCDDILGTAADNDWKRIAIAGSGDLAEIALLCALQHDIEIAGVIDPSTAANRFRHVPLVDELASLPAIDAVLVCDLVDPQGVYDNLAGTLTADRLLAPQMLKITTTDAASNTRPMG
jgi:DNA-binding MarR family transcriptional regulator